MATFSSEPRLPRELECKIFEMAALARPTTIPKLMLVSSRVKYWVEPLLYRVLVISSEKSDSAHGFPVIANSGTLHRMMAPKKRHFFRNAVKRIFVRGGVSAAEMEWILRACTHVFDCCALSLSGAALAPLTRLRRLTIKMLDFLECCKMDSTHPILASITHLDLRGICHFVLEDLYPCLSLVSNLTHFAIDSTSHDPAFQTALCASTRLECILFSSHGHLPLSRHEEMNMEDMIIYDGRFVCMARTIDFYLDWLHHTDTRRDFWAIADAFIQAKRQGKVERSVFTLSDAETSWLD
ncbi:hypothetical protein MSAN_02043400 [Mycena sanguinolenta]|uniref:Uncharacterized protein n=1 Tax=Mycena sanguinolenta TaxID=230812 RepID=A0A8H7CNL6_9AGAR|nr:hypothetical protein MSAN_02043400 [Mycena sanguinolenta]